MKANDSKKIVAVGVGGAGTRIINRMIENRTEDIEWIAIDTDWQSLQLCRACRRLYIGGEDAERSGTCADEDPASGPEAALLYAGDITEALSGAAMVFLLCGLGGSTGSGAAWVIAMLAKEQQIFTAAIVTRPFAFEDPVRRRNAEKGLRHLMEEADSVTVIPNDRTLYGADWDASIRDALQKADEVIGQIVSLLARHRHPFGVIPLTLEDLQWGMGGSGPAYIGIGRSRIENWMEEAVPQALASPWQDTGIYGADRVVVFLEGDFPLFQLIEMDSHIQPLVNEDAQLILGLNWMESDQCMVMVIASGIKEQR